MRFSTWHTGFSLHLEACLVSPNLGASWCSRGGLLSFLLSSYLTCTGNIGDPLLEQEYREKVSYSTA